MRRMTYFVMALALVLGFTQCKKEQPASQTEGVYITLNVENSGDRHVADPDAGTVEYQDGDVIYVGDGSHYIGTLTRQSGTFSGTIDPEPANGADIHFYFLGGLTPSVTPEAGSTSDFTVNISDQTSKLPVLSYEYTTYYEGTTEYSCELKNKCALVRFPLANAASSLLVGGMHNEATISFGGTTGIEPTSSVGQIRLYSKTYTEKWAILLPQAKVDNASVAIGNQSGLTVNVPAITANARIISISAIENASSVVDLSEQPTDYPAKDGDILTGILASTYKVTIPTDAIITLEGATIPGGIVCSGNTTIILEGENYVNNKICVSPGIQAPAPGYTLTIQGSGKLTSSPSGGYAAIGSAEGGSCGDIIINSGDIMVTGGSNGGAGIGSGYNGASCGNITINGGTIQAIGKSYSAGIGSGRSNSSYSSCGTITINGGTVVGQGHGDNSYSGAGIGSGRKSSCSDIIIGNGITQVKAIKARAGSYCIGAGSNGTSGSLIIDGITYTDFPAKDEVVGNSGVLKVTTKSISTWELKPIE